MPKKRKNEQPEEENVLVADEYHSKAQQEEEFESEDELFDYLKNNGRQLYNQAKEEAIQNARDNGQPFDLDYAEKGVMLVPQPCEISVNKNGTEIPKIVPPWELDDEDKDIAMVCFSKDMQPLYENDRHTLMKVKSTDPLFNTLNDDNAPAMIKQMNNIIKSVVHKWEAKHPLEPVEQPLQALDLNQNILQKIAEFAKVEISLNTPALSKADKDFWAKNCCDKKAQTLLIHYNIPAIKSENLNKFITTLQNAISRNLFDLKNIKVPKQKSR